MRLLAALLALLWALDAVWCGHKIRSHKAFSGRGRLAESEIYSFLSSIRAEELHASVRYEIVTPVSTTPPSTTTSTTSPTTPAATLADYCLGKRGQFAFEADCHKFVDCWDGRAFLKSCQPATLVFDPTSGQCTWPNAQSVRGRCGDSNARTESTATDMIECSREHGYACVPAHRCVNDTLRTGSTHNASTARQCATEGEVCCRARDSPPPARSRPSASCPSGFSGVRAHPSDCTKFVNCWKGSAVVQACAPGTHFNPRLAQCDFPHKAGCHVSAQQQHARGGHVGRDDGDVVVPTAQSGQRLRLRRGNAPYTGYVEIFDSGRWGLLCDAGQWTMKEAFVVCKQLGFARGVKATTQGLVHGPIDASRKATERVDCEGSEAGIDKCSVQYAVTAHQRESSCKLSEQVVSVTCLHDSFAACAEDEVPWGGACYSLHFNRSDFQEAVAECEAQGKTLVEITSQQENDLITELLLRQPDLDLAETWTGGVGTQTARAPSYLWHGSRQNIGIGTFVNWWPGWGGERKGAGLQNQGHLHGHEMGIKLSRSFDLRGEHRLTDYYFWALESLRSRLPFVCERPQSDIGCVRGNGVDYRGHADRSETGDKCVEWDSPGLSLVLDGDKVANLGPLQGNHFCRNPDGDAAPWCILANGEYDYCDIPACTEGGLPGFRTLYTEATAAVTAAAAKCSAKEFQCRAGGECVLAAYVCDGFHDCPGGEDEAACGTANGNANARQLDLFDKKGRSMLDVVFVERWLNVSAEACAGYCTGGKDFTCLSFNYHAAKRTCALSESNVGTSGKVVTDPQWDYYERREFSAKCSEGLKCPSGKCLSDIQICDGKDDCGDKYDERGCPSSPNLKLRLVDGRSTNEGRVEVKAFDFPFGGICDDGFDLEAAHVICRQLGFRLGAREALIGSHFGGGAGPILLDELRCRGNETSLLECTFDPWARHDCRDDEWAAVVCKNKEEACRQQEEWRCGSGECIPLEFVCDGRDDCVDASDEDKRHSDSVCRQDVAIRLADGDGPTSGRVEVRFRGIWGTVCDDNFGQEEAAVVCRMLGHAGAATSVRSQAAFGEGQGPIWLHNLVCNGNESSLVDCRAPSWQPTFQCKHLEDVGVECLAGNRTENRVRGGGGPQSSGMECGVAQVSDAVASVPLARIAAGMQSRPGSHPWAASIRLQGANSSFHWCGAVVVSEFHVLTAAHCMEDYPKDVYRVRVGDWDTQVADVEESEYAVETVYFHEQYNVGLYLNNDIAVVRVAPSGTGSGFRFGTRVRPACLPLANVAYAPGIDCTVTGWGSTGIAQGGFARYLQAARIPVLSTSVCMSPRVYGPHKLGSGMFCAGFLEGGVDTCQGDSGGGMFCKTRHNTVAVMGLTSWGYGCGRPNRPGVYTKVADYLDWIHEKLSK